MCLALLEVPHYATSIKWLWLKSVPDNLLSECNIVHCMDLVESIWHRIIGSLKTSRESRERDQKTPWEEFMRSFLSFQPPKSKDSTNLFLVENTYQYCSALDFLDTWDITGEKSLIVPFLECQLVYLIKRSHTIVLPRK